jgi:hypothetical protein
VRIPEIDGRRQSGRRDSRPLGESAACRLIAAALASAGLGACLVGCAGGAESAASSATSITRGRADAVAAAISLQRNDFPASAKAVPHASPAKESRESRAEERRCYGAVIPAWAHAVSKSFLEQTESGTRGTTSQVIIRRSAKEARLDLSRSATHGAQLCLAREVRRALANTRFHNLGDNRPTLGRTVVNALPVSVPGADGSAAWRYVTELRIGRIRSRAHQDVVVFAYGQDEAWLISFGIGRPYPTDQERSLAVFLLERARLHTR